MLRELNVPHFCKLVQPISWSARTPLWGSSPSQEALSFMQKIEEAAATNLPVKRLPELRPITKEDVLDYLDRRDYRTDLTPRQRDAAREKLASEILQGKKTSEEIIHLVSQALPDGE